MRNSIKFTIITVCFNSEKTIERTIKSVLAQSFDDYEYIIVDGASKDETLNIVKRYEALFEGRMKWKSEPDEGIYDAMNKGIRRSNGKIIGIVNSDDWLEPDALQIVNNAYLRNNRNNDILYCGCINYYKTNGSVKRWDVNLKSFKRQAWLYVMSGIRHPATFVPSQIYEKIGLFDEKMKLSADQDFILRCYFGGVGLMAIPEVLSNMSEGGISTEESNRSRMLSSEDRKRMLSKFGKKGMSYYWLYYSWLFRGFIKRMIAK